MLELGSLFTWHGTLNRVTRLGGSLVCLQWGALGCPTLYRHYCMN
jgi:hypothetical protein